MCDEVKWENWEWGEDDLDPEVVLELEQFGLSMFHLCQAILNLTFTFCSICGSGCWIHNGSDNTDCRNIYSQNQEKLSSTRLNKMK